MQSSQNKRQRSILELLNSDSYIIRGDYIDCSKNISQNYKHNETTIKKTSSHNYPDDLISLINEHKEGWALDCGAGAREPQFQNVINFDIDAFPGIDVVGQAEQLPFKDDCFDLVFSLAVLEHVKNPQRAATEMQRVLKPGGLLWIDVAFMQPYHGYPAHFYNMTQQGLANLLTSDMQIIRDTVPEYGTPIWSLSWIISKYTAALPEKARTKMLELPLKHFLKDPNELSSESINLELPESARKEMAATVSILAKKADQSS